MSQPLSQLAGSLGLWEWMSWTPLFWSLVSLLPQTHTCGPETDFGRCHSSQNLNKYGKLSLKHKTITMQLSMQLVSLACDLLLIQCGKTQVCLSSLAVIDPMWEDAGLGRDIAGASARQISCVRIQCLSELDELLFCLVLLLFLSLLPGAACQWRTNAQARNSTWGVGLYERSVVFLCRQMCSICESATWCPQLSFSVHYVMELYVAIAAGDQMTWS